MLERTDSLLVVIDVQERLARVMHQRERLLDNLSRMIRGAQALELPISWVEQNPRGLGPTVPEVADLLSGMAPIEKLSFSCCGTDAFLRELRNSGRRQVLLAGIEAHVCVYQTAADLVALGYHAEVIADATTSRTPENRTIGLAKAREAGASVTGTETALFELMRVAEGETFRALLRIVR